MSKYITIENLEAMVDELLNYRLAHVAKSGDYLTLKNRPTALSQFSNDMKFITKDALAGLGGGGGATRILLVGPEVMLNMLTHIAWYDGGEFDMDGSCVCFPNCLYECYMSTTELHELFEAMDTESFTKLFGPEGGLVYSGSTDPTQYGLDESFRLVIKLDGCDPEPTSESSFDWSITSFAVETDAETGDSAIIIGETCVPVPDSYLWHMTLYCRDDTQDIPTASSSSISVTNAEEIAEILLEAQNGASLNRAGHKYIAYMQADEIREAFEALDAEFVEKMIGGVQDNPTHLIVGGDDGDTPYPYWISIDGQAIEANSENSCEIGPLELMIETDTDDPQLVTEWTGVADIACVELYVGQA